MLCIISPHAEAIHITSWTNIIKVTAIYFSLEVCNSLIVQRCPVHSYVTWPQVCILDYNPAIFKSVGCPAIDVTPTVCNNLIKFTFDVAITVNTVLFGLSEYLLIKIFDVNSRAGCKE